MEIDWTRVLLVGMILVLLVCVGPCVMGGCGADYSDGFRAGVVSKISKKGIVWKSWEGDLLVGGMEQAPKGGGLVPMVFHFSVEDDTVAQKISEAAVSGKRVRLQYREWLVHPIRIGTAYAVTGVTEEGG